MKAEGFRTLRFHDESGAGEKGDSNKEKDNNEPCMSKTILSLDSYYPSYPGSCKCGASMDYTVASIPQSTDWLVTFPLLAAMEYLSAKGPNPDSIVSTLSKILGGRLAYFKDSYRVIGIDEKHVDIIRKGYKLTWDKLAPWQRFAPCNPVISAKASTVLDKEVIDLLKKGAICEMSPV